MAVDLPVIGEEPWGAKLNAAITALEVADSTHAQATDPHSGYQKESEKGAPSGYAGLDGSGKIPADQAPTGIYVPAAGGTMTGPLILPASTTGAAPVRIPQGGVPTAPANGDMWVTSAGLFIRVNNSTRQVLFMP